MICNLLKSHKFLKFGKKRYIASLYLFYFSKKTYNNFLCQTIIFFEEVEMVSKVEDITFPETYEKLI